MNCPCHCSFAICHIIVVFSPESVHKEEKYIVSMSMLHALLSTCTECAAVTKYQRACVNGAYAEFHISCGACGSERTWSTTQKLRTSFAINNLLSGAILFNGATASKVLRVMQTVGIVVPSLNTYMRHQRSYLHGVSRDQSFKIHHFSLFD